MPSSQVSIAFWNSVTERDEAVHELLHAVALLLRQLEAVAPVVAQRAVEQPRRSSPVSEPASGEAAILLHGLVQVLAEAELHRVLIELLVPRPRRLAQIVVLGDVRHKGVVA